MFFSDPAVAFANLRRACVPGARIAFASWHHSAENIFRHGLRRVAATLPAGTLPPAPGIDSPGPLGLATASKIGTSMTPGGWTSIKATPVKVEIDYATEESTGVDERMQIALAGNTGRALREAIVADSITDGAVRFTDTVCIDSATNTGT